jgi:hypothetical protein
MRASRPAENTVEAEICFRRSASRRITIQVKRQRGSVKSSGASPLPSMQAI